MSTSVGRWSAFNISMRSAEVLAVELVALFEEHDQLLEEAADAVGLVVVAGDRDLVAAHEDLDGERGFDEAQQLVALAEQTRP